MLSSARKARTSMQSGYEGLVRIGSKRGWCSLLASGQKQLAGQTVGGPGIWRIILRCVQTIFAIVAQSALPKGSGSCAVHDRTGARFEYICDRHKGRALLTGVPGVVDDEYFMNIRQGLTNGQLA
jgi:hypothetical protein